MPPNAMPRAAAQPPRRAAAPAHFDAESVTSSEPSVSASQVSAAERNAALLATLEKSGLLRESGAPPPAARAKPSKGVSKGMQCASMSMLTAPRTEATMRTPAEVAASVVSPEAISRGRRAAASTAANPPQAHPATARAAATPQSVTAPLSAAAAAANMGGAVTARSSLGAIAPRDPKTMNLHRELVAMLQRALLAARAAPPDWQRAEAMLSRAEGCAATLCDAGTGAGADDADGCPSSPEKPADRVRRAALALRRRRRVASVLDKVNELRASSAPVNATAKARQVGEAEVLALLTALLGDEALVVTAAASHSPTARAGAAPPETNDASGEDDGDGGTHVKESVMERLDRLRRGASLRDKPMSSAEAEAMAVAEATAIADDAVAAAAAATRRARLAPADGADGRAPPPTQPPPVQPPAPPVPRLNLSRNGAAPSPPPDLSEGSAGGSVTSESAAPTHGAPQAAPATPAASELLARLQSGMETARQQANSRLDAVEHEVTEWKEQTYRRSMDTLDSLWKRFGGSGADDGGGDHDPSRFGHAGRPRGDPHDFEGRDYVRAPTNRLTRGEGCRNRFSEADWAQRVRDKRVGFETAAGAATSGSVPPGAAADEWTLGPARPVHELDTVSRYDGQQASFHFC